MRSNNIGIDNIPDKKISETLLKFIQPIIDQADKSTTQHQLEKAFEMAVGIWNAVVQDKLNSNQKYVQMMRDRITDSASLDLLETYINRKKQYFSQDLRMISEFTIKYENGNLHVEAKGKLDNRILNSIPRH